jgi:hypothetical protein
MYNPSDAAALTFRVFPPLSDGTSRAVEVVAASYPTVITTGTDELDFSTEYRQVLADYIAYRCFSEDHANENNDAAAAKHFQLFNEQLEKYK